MLPCAPSTADALAVSVLPGRPDLVAGLGVLTCEVTPGLVDEVIEQAGCREKRRRLLPARTVVYFVLGMCLFSGADSAGPPGYRSVMRWLTNGRRGDARRVRVRAPAGGLGRDPALMRLTRPPTLRRSA
jgi:Insertion element 4 transposase N-terminal